MTIKIGEIVRYGADEENKQDEGRVGYIVAGVKATSYFVRLDRVGAGENDFYYRIHFSVPSTSHLYNLFMNGFIKTDTMKHIRLNVLNDNGRRYKEYEAKIISCEKELYEDKINFSLGIPSE